MLSFSCFETRLYNSSEVSYSLAEILNVLVLLKEKADVRISTKQSSNVEKKTLLYPVRILAGSIRKRFAWITEH